MVLSRIFLRTSDVEHFLRFLLPVCLSSLEKCLFKNDSLNVNPGLMQNVVL